MRHPAWRPGAAGSAFPALIVPLILQDFQDIHGLSRVRRNARDGTVVISEFQPSQCGRHLGGRPARAFPSMKHESVARRQRHMPCRAVADEDGPGADVLQNQIPAGPIRGDGQTGRCAARADLPRPKGPTAVKCRDMQLAREMTDGAHHRHMRDVGHADRFSRWFYDIGIVETKSVDRDMQHRRDVLDIHKPRYGVGRVPRLDRPRPGLRSGNGIAPGDALDGHDAPMGGTGRAETLHVQGRPLDHAGDVQAPRNVGDGRD
mgnify:FL=1